MEKIKDIKKRLEEVVCEELNHGIENIDCKEMSETIDMIKDLAMAMYYCQITDAMENSGAEYGKDYDEKGAYKYYGEPNGGYKYYEEPKRMVDHSRKPTPSLSPEDYRMGEYNYGRMYYTETENMGNSGKVRMKYMDNASADESTKMEILEDYLNVLGDDVMQMIANASEDEKDVVRRKFQVWSQRL